MERSIFGVVTSQILASRELRTHTINGIKYRSFTPHPGNPLNYEIRENFCCNIISYPTADKILGDCSAELYIKSTLAQLAYNNLISDYGVVKNVFLKWIVNWRGNESIKKYPRLEEFIDSLEPILTTTVDFEKCITFNTTKRHWYPDRLEEINDSQTRKKLKSDLRSGINSEALKEDIISASKDYQNQYWGVLPTVKNLEHVVSCKASAIRTHGKGYFISTKKQTATLIQILLRLHPGLSLRKFKKKIEADYSIKYSVTTLNRYWKL